MVNRIPEADALIGRRLPILDHGYVELVDYLGSDKRIADCARQSYGKCDEDHTANQDEALIKRMVKNGHSSPFEQVVLVFKLRMPILVARQWVRHRTARMNEISGRYTKLKHETFTPDISTFAMRSPNPNDIDETAIAEKLSFIEPSLELAEKMFEEYDKMADAGIPLEVARSFLPVGTYTEFYWQIDANNLMKFLSLRLEEHAMKEIQLYASLIFDLASLVIPYTMKWFVSERFNTVPFNAMELFTMADYISGVGLDADGESDMKKIMVKIIDSCKKFETRTQLGIGCGENPVIKAIQANPEKNIIIEYVVGDAVLRTTKVDAPEGNDGTVTVTLNEVESNR